MQFLCLGNIAFLACLHDIFPLKTEDVKTHPIMAPCLQRVLLIAACGLFAFVSASCSDYTSADVCMDQSNCGWCSAGCCISGGSQGDSCTCFGGAGCAGGCAAGISIGIFLLFALCCMIGWRRYRYRRVVIVQAAPVTPIPATYGATPYVAQPGYAPLPQQPQTIVVGQPVRM